MSPSTSPPACALPTHPADCRALVIGGGIMGSGIATVLARAGADVQLLESDTGRREALAARHAEAGLARPPRLAASLQDVEADGLHLAVECIPENLPAKQALFTQLCARLPGTAVLTSNSSSYPITEIAGHLPADVQARCAGLHFFMPADQVPLVEVVLGAQTAADVAGALSALMRGCRMVPVTVRKDVPGFLANRLQHAIAREAYALIEAGIVSIEDVDAAVRFGFGFRYLAAGPMLQRDHGGLDTHAAAAERIYPTLCNDTAPAALLTERARDGRLGLKSGEGFYVWDEAGAARERQRYQGLLQAAMGLLENEIPPADAKGG